MDSVAFMSEAEAIAYAKKHDIPKDEIKRVGVVFVVSPVTIEGKATRVESTESTTKSTAKT